jgi:hypothetical protein
MGSGGPAAVELLGRPGVVAGPALEGHPSAGDAGSPYDEDRAVTCEAVRTAHFRLTYIHVADL